MTTLCAPGDFQRLGNIGQANTVELAATVSAIAENHCCRPLILRTTGEWYEPGTTRIIRLKRYPVVSINRLMTDLSGMFTVQAIGTPWRATVQIVTADGTPYSTPTGLTLSQLANGVSTSVNLPFASYATVASLVPAIDGLGGWTASITNNMGQCPTTELFPTTGALGAATTPAQIMAFATTIEEYDLKPETGKLTLYQIRPDAYQYPNRTFAPLTPSSKVLSLYTAGYNGDPANGTVTSPPDLVEACVEIGRAVLDGRIVSGVFGSVELGNSKYQVGTMTAVPDNAARLLAPYVDRRF